MARGMRPWVMATLVACGIAAIAYLPPRGGSASQRRDVMALQLAQPTRARLRAQALTEEWRAAQAAVRLAEERQRLGEHPTMSQAKGTPSFTVRLVGDATITPAVVSRIAATLDTVWHSLGLGETKISVGVVLDLGVGTRPTGMPPEESGHVSYLLPDSTDRTTCLVRIPASTYWRRAILLPEPGDHERVRQWLRSGLGPCAFYAAYGAPGRHVRRWLARREFDLALVPEWDASGIQAGTRQMFIRWGDRWSWDAVYHQSFPAVACLAGRAAGCRTAVLAGADEGLSRDSLPRVVTVTHRWWRRQRLVGATWYLSDVAREVGRHRFLEFWNSSLPVDTALALALKQPVGEWTATWQLRSVPRVPLGAAAPVSASILALLLAGGAVASVVLTARRRQVR